MFRLAWMRMISFFFLVWRKDKSALQWSRTPRLVGCCLEKPTLSQTQPVSISTLHGDTQLTELLSYLRSCRRESFTRLKSFIVRNYLTIQPSVLKLWLLNRGIKQLATCLEWKKDSLATNTFIMNTASSFKSLSTSGAHGTSQSTKQRTIWGTM